MIASPRLALLPQACTPVPTSLSISGHRGEKATLGDDAGEDCSQQPYSILIFHYFNTWRSSCATGLLFHRNQPVANLPPPPPPWYKTTACHPTHFADSVFRVLLCRKNKGLDFCTCAFFLEVHLGECMYLLVSGLADSHPRSRRYGSCRTCLPYF
jgi:hypothetical protein